MPQLPRAPRFRAVLRAWRRQVTRPLAGPTVVGVGLIGSLAILAGPPVTAGTPAEASALLEQRLARLDRAAVVPPSPTPPSAVAGVEATGDPASAPLSGAPAVADFRPLDGTTGVPAAASVSVRFDRPMERSSVEAAFRATVDGSPVGGALEWRDDDTVLVLLPTAALPFGARVELSVEPGAADRTGATLADRASATFTVESRPAPTVPAPALGSVDVATPAPSRAPARAQEPATRVAASNWQWPANGPITQRFGQTLTKYGFHQGLDIAGAIGNPVRAAHGGVVKVAGRYDNCSGLQVTVDHGDGRETWYRHLSRLDVRVGQRVSAGTLVGGVGNGGCSLGAHLHFAVRQGGTFVDPERFLPRR